MYVGGDRGVFLSTDNGKVWTARANSPRTVRSLVSHKKRIYAGTYDGGIFFSTNLGDTWTASYNNASPVNSLGSNDSALFAGIDFGGGFLASQNDGATWEKRVNGITNSQPNAIAATDSLLVAGLFTGLHLSRDAGRTWETPNISIKYINDVVASKNEVFVASGGYGICHSTDHGVSWNAANLGLPGLEISSITMNDTIVFAALGSDGLVKSTDRGTTWIPVNVGLSFSYIWLVRIIEGNIFAATSGNGVIRSTDGGSNWTAIGNGLPKLTIYGLAGEGNYLYVGMYDRVDPGSGVYRSTNSGATWSQLNSGLTSTMVLALCLNGTNVFAGTEYGGIFILANHGDQWVEINNQDLIHRSVRSICSNTSDLFVGLTGGGVWKRRLSEVVTTANITLQYAPRNIRLNQNYPNPFNPSTQIRYTLPRDIHVSLKVYNVLGKEVETLLNGVIPAGTHVVTWNATNVPSGVYFYRLQAGSFTETKKLLLLK